MKRKIFFGVLAIFIFFCLPGMGNFALAQTGDIRGHVEDAESGEPLPGVNVVVVGTQKGAATDEDGDFIIINVDPGTYSVQASMIGYAEVTKTNVLVTMDQIARVNFSLESEAIRGQEVVVEAERDIIHTEVSNSQIVSTAEEILEAPAIRTVREFLANQPGVSSTENLSIRGGASHETGFVVDGLTLVDERLGRAQADIPLSSVEQLSVLTGGYNAEYGEFRSGIINVKTKTGSREEFNGRVDISRNVPHMKRFGESIYEPYNPLLRPYLDPEVAFVGTKDAWEDDPYLKQQHPSFQGWNKLEESYNTDKPEEEQIKALELYLWNAWMRMVEPPFDKLEESGYSVSDELKQKMIDHAHTPEGQYGDYNIDFGFGGPLPLIGSALGNTTFFFSHNTNRAYYAQPVTINASNQQSTLLTLRSNLTQDLKLTLNGYYRYRYGASEDRRGEVIQGSDNVNNFADYGETYHWYQTYFHTKHENTYMGGLILNKVVSSRTFWEFRFNGLYDRGRTPSNAEAFPRDPAVKARFGPVAVTEMPYHYSPGYEQAGDYKYGMYDQNYGLSHRFANKAGEKEQKSDTYQYRARFNFTSQVSPHHQIKTGLQLHYTTFDHWMYWVRPFKNETARNYNWSDNTPLNTGVYFQDRITYEGIVANLGLRADYYSPGGKWPEGENYNFDLWGTIAPPSEDVIENAQVRPIWDLWREYDQEHPGFLQPVESHFAISPRIGLAFPVTANSKFYFNYGHFRALPPAYEMYHIDRRPYRKGFIARGNPNMEPPRTISYETGVEYNLLNQYLIRIAGYYKDITGNPEEMEYTSADGRVNWETWVNNEYRDIQGLELSVTKSFGNFVTGWANYNYMLVKHGRTGVEEQFEDPTKTELFGRYEGDESRPLPRPQFRASVTFRMPENLGLTSPLNAILGNWRISLLPVWRAGSFFTWNPLGKFHLDDNLQWPDYFRIDGRLTRIFRIARGARIEAYVDVSNLLNNKINNMASGNPFYGGSDRREYLASLHLPMYDSEEFDVLREQNPGKYIAGNDKIGDLRSDDKPYINDPNLMDLWGFIQPRDIWFGIRVQF